MVDINQVVRETLALRAYEQRVTNIIVIDALAAGLRTCSPTAPGAAGAAEPDINAEQAMLSANGRGRARRRTWHDAEQRVRHPRDQRRWPGIADDVQRRSSIRSSRPRRSARAPASG
jgi:hypothetical protein